MIKKSSIALRESKLITLPYNFDNSNIEEFDDLIYNAYILKTTASLKKALGLFLTNGVKEFENSALVISKKTVNNVSNNKWMLKNWVDSEFSVFLDSDNLTYKSCYGDVCYYVDDISKLTNKGILGITYVGKCVIQEDVDAFNKKYKNLLKFYPNGLFDKIKSFVLLEKKL